MEKKNAPNKNNFFIRLCYGYVGGKLGKDTSKMTTSQVVQEFLNAKGVSSPKEFFKKKLLSKNNKAEPKNNKQQQLDIIQKHNPMGDDYHVGIRTVEDIKTFEEAIQDDESFVYGDYTYEDAQRDLARGKVIVYSSKPIGQGGFVSTSKNMARDYAGTGKIYSQEVDINDVAWINGDEGQYAKVEQTEQPKQTKANKKQEVIDFVKHQINVDLDTSGDSTFGKRNVLYVGIPAHKEAETINLLKKKGYRVESHMKNRYWIYL